MSASATVSKTVKWVLRIVALLTAAVGAVTIFGFIAMCTAVFQHIWVYPQPSDIAIELLFTLAGVAFGAYIIYLAYRLAFQPDRRVLERVYFLTIVSLVVAVVGRRPLSPTYFLFCAAIATFGWAFQHFISKRLFSDDT
jgi:hypothetical protein